MMPSLLSLVLPEVVITTHENAGGQKVVRKEKKTGLFTQLNLLRNTLFSESKDDLSIVVKLFSALHIFTEENSLKHVTCDLAMI